MLGDNKLNYFKTMQVLGSLTLILIWGSKIAKVLPDKLGEDLELWYQGGT